MSNTTKIILFGIIVAVLFWPSGGKLFPPKVNADDYIFGPDSLAVASLFMMVEGEEAPSPTPDNLVTDKCKCTNGKISFDGGTSWTDCPCKTQGPVCGYKDCPCGKLAPKSEPVKATPKSDPVSVESYLGEYFISKLTSPSCLPCKRWDKDYLSSFKANNIEVRSFNIDEVANLNVFEASGFETIPSFLICTKVDNIFHRQEVEPGFLGFNGSTFNVDDAKRLIAELDAQLHPHRKDGVFYKRQQKEETALNGKKTASRSEYLVHLRTDKHIGQLVGWDLDQLSRYELKAIHDDSHAGKLGPYSR